MGDAHLYHGNGCIEVKWQKICVDRFMRKSLRYERPRAYCKERKEYVMPTDRIAINACDNAFARVV